MSDGRVLYCDPWLSDGAWHGTWYNFPPVKDKELYKLKNPDFIYISHVHQDHFDEDLLSSYAKDTELWIANHKNGLLYRKLSALGFKNIVKFDVNKKTDYQKFEITIFDDFSGSSMGHVNLIPFEMDTSLLLREKENNRTFFNINDNTIQLEDAKKIKQEYGDIDLLIAPYCGASIFPQCFSNYSHEEKLNKRNTLSYSMLEKFCEVVNEIKPQVAIPVAGSYVIGGERHEWSEYLYQATPEMFKQVTERQLANNIVCDWLYEGDTIDLETKQIQRNDLALFKDFTFEDRLKYANSLKDKQYPYQNFQIPKGHSVPFALLLKTARQNLYKKQERYNAFPDWEIIIDILNENKETTGTFRFSMSNADKTYFHNESTDLNPAPKRYVRYKVPSNLLLLILTRAANWDNIESGSHLELTRYPDEYVPTVHYLMSFLHL